MDNHALKIESQFRGSQHLLAFVWSSEILELSQENSDYYATNIVRTDLPDPNVEPELHDLVSHFQIHKHPNSCKKDEILLPNCL